MQWIFANAKRFLHERSKIMALCEELSGLTAVWRLSTDMGVRVDFDLQIRGRVFEGRMEYPEVFPHSPPIVRPRDRNALWTGHQYGAGGALCLEWRPDNWDPCVTGADMLRSTHTLLSTEHGEFARPAAVPDAHQVTLGQSLRGETARCVFTRELVAAFSELANGASAQLKTRNKLSLRAEICFVTEMEGAGVDGVVAGLPAGIRSSMPLFVYPGTGRVFRSNLFDSHPSPITLEELRDLIGSAGFNASCVTPAEAEPTKPPLSLVVLLGEKAVHVLTVESGTPIRLVKNAVLLDESNSRSAPEAQSLKSMRVGIVGLGSMGSKVAVSLARAGVRHFELVDDDIFLPGNVGRHELTWACVGSHKVDAIRDQLQLIAADMNVSAHVHRIGGQESSISSASVMNRLSECNLIVDTTANPEVFLRLAPIAQRAKVSMVWGEVFATGYGGLICRARPDLDPNPLAVRDSFNRYAATQPKAPYQSATGYDGSEHDPLIALDSDVGFIATALTRLAIDTGLRRVPSDYPVAIYLVGMRKDWIFEAPFDTRPIVAVGPGWDSDTSEADPEVMRQALEAVREMLPEPANANRSVAASGG